MTPSREESGLSTYRALLESACRRAGLDATSAELLKLTNNAVFALADRRYVVRIAASGRIGEQAAVAVRFAHWLSRNDIPTIVPVEEIDQPFEVDGHAVTIWHRVDDTGETPDVEHLSSALRRLHDETAPAPDLPPFDQIAEIRPRLDHENLPTDLRLYLAGQLDELDQALTDVEFTLPFGPIHADAHTGALIAAPRGPVLCDFDSAAVGHREWDLLPTAVNAARFTHMADQQDRFAAVYGFDLREWPHFQTLRRIRELQVTTTVIPILAIDPGVRAEFHLRLRTIRENDDRPIWTPWPLVDLAAMQRAQP